jgi:hypothetical protein
MDRILTHEPRWTACSELAAAGVSPSRLEQYRLERLLELRAVIDSLRSQDSRGPVRIPNDRPRNLHG